MISGCSYAKSHSSERSVSQLDPILSVTIAAPRLDVLRHGYLQSRFVTRLRSCKIKVWLGPTSQASAWNGYTCMPFVMTACILEVIRGPAFDLQVAMTRFNWFSSF